MLRRDLLVGLAGLALVGPALVTPAEAATWVFLGKRKVNGRLDHDRIVVGIWAGTFDKIKLRVTGNDVRIDDLDVTYGNGMHDDIAVRRLIRQGGETRAIDLRFNNRFIRHVDFTYGKFRNGRGATYVELWGRR